MRLGDVVAKQARGIPLTPDEIAFLRDQMNLIQNTTAITSGWIGGGQQPGVKTITADRAELKTLPGNVVYRGLTPADTPYSVANGGASVDWDTADWSAIYNDVYPCVEFTATKIDLPNRIPTLIHISGSVWFFEDSGAQLWLCCSISQTGENVMQL